MTHHLLDRPVLKIHLSLFVDDNVDKLHSILKSEDDVKPRDRFSIAALTGDDAEKKPKSSPAKTVISSQSVRQPLPLPISQTTVMKSSNHHVHPRVEHPELVRGRLIYWLDKLSRLQPDGGPALNLTEDEVHEVIQLSCVDGKFASEVCRLPCYPQIWNNLMSIYKRDIPTTQSFAK